VYEAYKAVKSNKGAAGVDGQTIEQFEADLKGNLYKIWNRMSSGTYFPPPVHAVSIPKKSGGERILGVPTVGDRIAQMVVKQLIEPDLDPIFLPDSRAHLIGLSMGGYAALQFGLRYPEKTSALVAASVGSGSHPSHRDAWLRETSVLARIFIAPSGRAAST
jgi:hypothetical protein